MFVSCMLIAQVKLGLKNSKISWGKEEEEEKVFWRNIEFILNI